MSGFLDTSYQRDEMMQPPLVTFIVISYKHADYIDDCMKSILAQTYADMEIIYLDDASGDDSFQKAVVYKEKLEKKYRRVIFIENQKNCGLVKNLNRLIVMAKGKYVKFLAADDFMLEDGIEKSVAFMETHAEYDMMHSKIIRGDENTHYPLSAGNAEDSFQTALPVNEEEMFDYLYERDFIPAPSVMMKRDVYDRLGLYDEEIGIEDWEYYLRVAKDGKIGYLDDYTVLYRFLSSSLSHSASPQRRMNMKKSEMQILEKYKDYAKNPHARMEKSLNEALQDAFHIDMKDYLAYIYDYAKRNDITISFRNRFMRVLYYIRIIKIGDYLISLCKRN